MSLGVESTECGVGPFRADILCRNQVDDSFVLIENQIESTDHSHLGQLLTYAAGLAAVTIIWVASRFTDEHRAALDWLNTITNEKFNFFGLEIELWRIGASPAAPKFNVVCQPNEWVRTTGRAVRNGDDLSPTRQQQQEYWTTFKALLTQSRSGLRTGSPRPESSFGVAWGDRVSRCVLSRPPTTRWISRRPSPMSARNCTSSALTPRGCLGHPPGAAASRKPATCEPGVAETATDVRRRLAHRRLPPPKGFPEAGAVSPSR